MSHEKNTLNKEQSYCSAKASGLKRKLEHWHMIVVWLLLYDIVAANGAYFLALWLRFDSQFSEILPLYLNAWSSYIPIHTIVCIGVFTLMKLYRSLWRFAGYNEFERIFWATLITAGIHTVGITLLFQRMPASYYIVGAGLQFMLILAVRFAYRLLNFERSKRDSLMNKAQASRVMLIGAGAAGQLILRDIQSTREMNEWVYCIIDDNPNKWGRFIEGVPIVGGRDDILLNVEKYKIEKIYLAIPSASATERRNILNICKETSCELKSLPGMYQLVMGTVKASDMQDVNIEDLLGREPVKVQLDEIRDSIAGKVVLVTGGGGSIGSELCRQIAKQNPEKLIVFDIYENSAHAIKLELEYAYPELNLEVLIGSVRDSKRVNQVFEKYRPEIVFHAAAHKHVPLMEDSPCEAIKNNAIGTYKTAYAAMVYGCKRFVLISTDKAVNPTNVMGASKRICEMIIQSFDQKIREGRVREISPIHMHIQDEDEGLNGVAMKDFTPQTDFVAVRFGNVLGSNGSVIPHFKEQIARGGPVTVTHPDVVRYFMTIPEAASLVLQAGTYAKGGEIFVLDMGSPVKIDTLARNLIRLSGLKPDVDIKISYIGLRPGEKLYEEKLMDEEGLRRTPNKLIHIGTPIPFDTDTFLKRLETLMELAYDGEDEQVKQLMIRMVSTFHPTVHVKTGVKLG